MYTHFPVEISESVLKERHKSYPVKRIYLLLATRCTNIYLTQGFSFLVTCLIVTASIHAYSEQQQEQVSKSVLVKEESLSIFYWLKRIQVISYCGYHKAENKQASSEWSAKHGVVVGTWILWFLRNFKHWTYMRSGRISEVMHVKRSR